MLQEFKDFINQGNVVDLAVGVIIGAAFGKIVDVLVNGIVMPPIGLLLGGVNFDNIFINLSGGDYASLAAATEAGAATINIGSFINVLIEFLIIALAVFLLVKAVNSMKKQAAEAPVEPAVEEVLLTEIRDLLKARN